MGRLGGLYETLSPAMFWGLHAGVAAAGGVAVLVLTAHRTSLRQVLSTLSLSRIDTSMVWSDYLPHPA
jgi:hypothetical protein